MQRLVIKVCSSWTSNDRYYVCSSGNLCWSSFDGCFDSFVFGIQNFGNIALYLFTFRLNIFNGKGDHCSSNLHSHGVMGLQAKLIFQQDDCTELRRVVFNVKSVMFAFYDCVTSGNTDIIDSNLRFMTSTKFKLSLFRCDSQQMDIPGSILVQWHGFKKNVVGLS